MTPDELRQSYIDFFVDRGHAHIPSASIVPENDPTTLFTGSGMQPMVPYLLGEKHPLGTRIVDSQRCFRSQDIEEVGDRSHDTFFEMLGNWSLGDYFKQEQIPWIFDFFTKEIGLDPQRLYITVFRGREDLNIPKDTEAVKIWQQVYKKIGINAKDIDFPEKNGMQDGRIFYYSDRDNWWSRAGVPDNMPIGEPGGPCSEIFFDFGADLGLHEKSPFKDKPCHVNCDCGRFFEIGNNVFMAYIKTKQGFKPLENKNIDYGGGFERILAAINDDPDIFKTALFQPLITSLEKLSGKDYQHKDFQPSFRVVVDHLKGAVMLASDGVIPDSKQQGYFSRRLIRRAVRHGKKLGLDKPFLYQLVDQVAGIYQRPYPDVKNQTKHIRSVIKEEETKFHQTLSKGLKEFKKLTSGGTINGQQAFYLYETFGFPIELTLEEADSSNVKPTKAIQPEFEKAQKSHADKSRSQSAGVFKGGLADHSESVVKLHTATHLLHAALRRILGAHVHQEGSHITGQRLRFDFTHPEKITQEQIKQIEDQINQKIKQDLKVTKTIEDKDQALGSGAMAFFKQKYPDRVSVYTIGDPKNFYSKEFCGGPHVSSTGEIGAVTITKQESIGAGKRRLYASLA